MFLLTPVLLLRRWHVPFGTVTILFATVSGLMEGL